MACLQMKIKLFPILLFFLLLNFANAEKIPFIYKTADRQTTLPVEWNEKWFGQSSSYEYHHGIARIACLFSALSYNQDALETNYHKLGIASKDIFFNYNVDYSSFLWGNDQCAFSIASKPIDSSIGKQTLVIVNIRGTPLNANEWLSNLNIHDPSQTNETIHMGFGKAASIIYTKLISYLLRNRIDSTDSFLLITGHSRGGAVSNLLARTLYDDQFFKSENCYVYTFASPNVTSSEEAKSRDFDFIWNIVSAEDIVPTLPFNRNEWHFKKYGHTLSFANYTNTEHDFYENHILPQVNELYKSFFGRDYYPFYTGPFLPVFITRLASRYIENVEKFYNGYSGLHSKAVDLMYKIFPSMEDQLSENNTKRKSKFLEKIKAKINEKHEGLLDYLENALIDMHQIETYLSFILVTDQDDTYSNMDYNLVSIEGAVEIAVFDNDKNTYLEVIEGYDGFENQKRPVAAIPAGVKNLIVGVPSNMEFELFLTDDTILHSPARIKIEHYDSAGVYKGCSEVQKIYLNMYSACKFKIGKELLDKDKVQHKSLTYKERKEFVNIANLKPEYHFRVYPEFTYGLNNNITAGIHYGIPILYGTALLNYNLSNANKGFDFIAGIGNKIAFYGKYSLDVELLEKTCIFSSSADTDKKLSFVPEVKLSLSKNIIAKTTSCVSFAFDFNINDFNNDAFFSDIRKQRFGSWKINSNLKVYPSIQFGIRF